MPDDDYDAIEAAVMDTARGRWFLAEFARRNRTADTSLLLTAIERLEGLLGRNEEPPPIAHQPVPMRAITSSAASELFAVDAHVETAIPSAGLPDDGKTTWVIEEPPAREALRVRSNGLAVDDEDEDIFWQPATPPPPVTAPLRSLSVPAPAPAISSAPIPMTRPSLAEAVPAVEKPVVEKPAEKVLAATEKPAPEKPVAPLQSAMLAAALAQAEETMARAAEPEPPPPPGGYSPPMADPAGLDAMSFEEKSVFFA